MAEYMIPISPGEFVDRFSILEIKFDRITDETKRHSLRMEFERMDFGRILESAVDIKLFSEDAVALLEINKKLWDAEDKIREYERSQFFGNEFIEVARSIYKLNDERCRLKNEITKKHGFDNMIEIKSHNQGV